MKQELDRSSWAYLDHVESIGLDEIPCDQKSRYKILQGTGCDIAKVNEQIGKPAPIIPEE